MTIYVNARAIIERNGSSETELLLQIRARPGEPERWELPGGQIERYESVLDALEREIAEETGLSLELVHGRDQRVLHYSGEATVETFEPFFGYQTLDGPVDSLGFYFRCRVSGEPVQSGDDTKRPTWVPLSEVEEMFRVDPGQFDWLTQAGIERYLSWVSSERE